MWRVVPILCVGLAFLACAGSQPSESGHSAAATPPERAPQTRADRPSADSTTAVPMQAGIRISEDGRNLVDTSGDPWLLAGDAAWSLLVQLTVEETEAYLDARRAQGYNALVVNLIEHEFADDPPRNANGDPPFTTAGDFSTPNPAYFDHVDTVLELAAERGFVVLLAPAYLGANGGEEGWYAEMTENGTDVLFEYGRYLGERYAALDNIIWLGGGDFTPPDQGLALVNAIAEGIKTNDSESLHAASWSYETSGLDVPVDWIDINTIYTYQPVHLESIEQYRQHPNVPHIFFEGEYEAEAEFTTPQLVRGQAYHALLTGATGHVYGHGDVWRFTPRWRPALEAPGAASLSHLTRLFSEINWHELVPDLDNQILTSAAGDRNDRNFAVAAATANRDLAVMYVPDSPTIELDLSTFGEPVTARFYDPSNGSFEQVPGSPLEADPEVVLTMPDTNAAGDTDWVVIIEPAAR